MLLRLLLLNLLAATFADARCFWQDHELTWSTNRFRNVVARSFAFWSKDTFFSFRETRPSDIDIVFVDNGTSEIVNDSRIFIVAALCEHDPSNESDHCEKVDDNFLFSQLAHYIGLVLGLDGPYVERNQTSHLSRETIDNLTRIYRGNCATSYEIVTRLDSCTLHLVKRGQERQYDLCKRRTVAVSNFPKIPVPSMNGNLWRDVLYQNDKAVVDFNNMCIRNVYSVVALTNAVLVFHDEKYMTTYTQRLPETTTIEHFFEPIPQGRIVGVSFVDRKFYVYSAREEWIYNEARQLLHIQYLSKLYPQVFCSNRICRRYRHETFLRIEVTNDETTSAILIKWIGLTVALVLSAGIGFGIHEMQTRRRKNMSVVA